MYVITGMMAASMIAGCGNSGNASANAGADTNTDASADAADSSADQSADVTPDTTAANSASAATGDFDNSEYINVVSREDGSGTRGAFIELFGVEEKMMPVRKLIIQPMKQSSQTVPTLC